jgi:hypothetical protein
MVMPSALTEPIRSLIPFGALGPRTAPIPFEYAVTTLIVGVGQVGWHAASLLSTMVNTTFSAKEIARIQYFSIARRPSVIPEGRLPREQTLLLTSEEIDWVAVPGRYAGTGVARWWPKPPRDKTLVANHAAIRAYNRLLLFENPNLVTETLEQRTKGLLQNALRPGSDGRIAVILVGSLAEAEGSALLFDVAQTLHHQLNEVESGQLTFTALLTADATLENPEERTSAMAHVYATLKELDAILAAPGHYQIGLPKSKAAKETTTISLSQRRLFDYVLLTGDVNKPLVGGLTPAAPLAEMGLTWLLNTRPKQAEPPLPRHEQQTERFEGYTTFSIVKLAMPTGVAGDLIGSRLATQALTAMNQVGAKGSAEGWVDSTLRQYRDELMIDTLLSEGRVQERIAEMMKRTRLDAITADINKQKDRADFSLKRIVEELIRKLDYEDRTLEMLDAGHTAHRLDTLHTRAEDILDRNLRSITENFHLLPTQLSCLQGRGLRWTSNALDLLSSELNRTLNALRTAATEAQRAWEELRRRTLNFGGDLDERYSGVKRLLRGSNAKELADMAALIEQATFAVAEHIRLTTGAVYWNTLWESIVKLQQEVSQSMTTLSRTQKQITEYAEAVKKAMEGATQAHVEFPAGALVDGNWYQSGVAAAMPRADTPNEQVLQKLYRQWSTTQPAGERRVDRFLRDLLMTSRNSLMGSLQFAPLGQYIAQNIANSNVQQALIDIQKSALPQWLPSRETTGWSLYEWVRGGTLPNGRGVVIPPQPNATWRRQAIPSPDPDEVCFARLTHNVAAEMLEPLRGPYRRAYDRTAADGVPLHLDRRMDATLPDLIRNTALADVSSAWEQALQSSLGGAAQIRQPLATLVRMFAIALSVDPSTIQRIQTASTDFALTVFPLPTYRLRLPPPQCPIVFTFSTRRPRELGQSIFQAVTELSLPEPFVFLVNVNNSPDIEVVVETLRTESYNVVVLNEATFKRVVGSRQPISMLGEVVLSEVDLTLISPFYTKAPVPERMFYGREREIKDVRRKLKTHSVALIGGRRIGKTSTLQQLERLLRAPDSGQVPYYLDCHNSMSYQHFFSAIRRRWNITTETPDPTAFEDIVSTLARRHPDSQLIFLFDEVDRLLLTDQKQEHSELLFRTFRALSNEKSCQFIFSGERWLARAMDDSFSALFNFAQPVRLTMLEAQIVAKLVNEPFEMMNIWLEDAPALIKRMMEISAGHPNIVQTICQEMITAVDGDRSNLGLLNIGHLKAAMNNHKLQEEVINTFWGQMSDLARIITLVWPADERYLTLEQIIERVKGAGLRSISVQEMKDAMRDLELYLFVLPTGRKYELIPVDFPNLLDEMTIKGLEISAMIERIEAQRKKEMLK